ncbi:MAG: hypothetical protein H7308_18835 [Chthonomonadaceae bacterium]|nr:hypothetical protein [Chthonomonadaceae bacterium]
MSILKRMACGCLLLPVILVATCTGKMAFDRASYILPGEVLRSSVASTKTLGSPMQVAEALDAYVQPRFEILRDKSFGAFRIVYRKHAGIVQLKVDTEQEKTLIANVNAAKRDYAIYLLHCVKKPMYHNEVVKPSLQLLYFNQEQLASEWASPSVDQSMENSARRGLHWMDIEKKVVSVLPRLMKGKESRTKDASWEILMRPVLALNPECLSCHKGATSGATLGVMVYAVRNTPGHATTGVSLR